MCRLFVLLFLLWCPLKGIGQVPTPAITNYLVNLLINDQAVDTSGYIFSVGNGDGIYISKTDFQGNIYWEINIPDPSYILYGHAIAVDAHSIYIMGNGVSVNGGPDIAFIVRLNKDGDFLWRKDITSSPPYAKDIVIDSLGGCVGVGVANNVPTPASYAGVIISLDSTGTMRWGFEITLGSALTGTYSISAGSDNSLYVCGNTTNGDAILVKISSTGTIAWAKSYLAANTLTSFRSIYYREDTLYICGQSDDQMLLAKCDTAGNVLLSRTFQHGQFLIYPLHIQTTERATVLISGSTNDSSGFVQEVDNQFNFIRCLIDTISYGIEGSFERNNEYEMVSSKYIGGDFRNTKFYLDSLWTPECSVINDTLFASAITVTNAPLTYILGAVAMQSNVFTPVDTVIPHYICTSPVIAIQEHANVSDLVFPNPTSGLVNLVLTEQLTANSEIRVINSTGQIVMVLPVEAGIKSVSIDLHSYPSGLYHILLGNMKPVTVSVTQD